MLQITVPANELFDEKTNEFILIEEQTLKLEHSLVSLSKWESKWCKPFLTKHEKTHEETIDYIKCMTLTQNVNPLIYECLSNDNIRKINEYIEAPMTATFFSNSERGKNSREIITSELIYYWMIALNIPFECQKWHLSRLLKLIEVCNAKSEPPQKMSRSSILKQNAALNAARRKKYNTKG